MRLLLYVSYGFINKVKRVVTTIARASHMVLFQTPKSLPRPVYSSVGSEAGCQSRGCAFEPQLFQHSFYLDKSHCDERHSSPTNELTVYLEKQPVALEKSVMYNYGMRKT